MGLLVGSTVPSGLHELIVDLIRADPSAIVALTRDAGASDAGTDGDVSAARVLDPSVPQHVAPAHSCDLVIELPAREPGGIAAGSAFLVEVQLRRRRRKEWIWPLCWAAMYRQLRGGRVWLVVITTRDSVARWATQVLARVVPAAGGWAVIGPGTMARIIDRQEAREQPGRALLSAFIHGGRDDVDLAPAVAEAFSTITDERGMLIHDLLTTRLSREAVVRWEELMEMKGHVWRSDFAVRHRAEGRQEGRAEGRQEGRAEGLRDSLIAVMAARALVPAPEQRDAIIACSDPVRLETWLRRAATAATVDDVIAP